MEAEGEPNIELHDYEKYFQFQLSRSTKKKSVSEEIATLLNTPTNNQVEDLFDPQPYIQYYDSWHAISARFTLLFYGVGSKFDLLHHFATTVLSKSGFVVEIDGFSGEPHITQAGLNEIGRELHLEHFTVPDLSHYCEENKKHCYFIIHSLDGSSVSDKESQLLISQLATSPNISVICSIDRIPFLSLPFYSALKCWPVEINTFKNHTYEIVLSGNGGDLASDAIEHIITVIGTLPDVAQSCYPILVNHQLKEGTGLSYSDWLDKSQTQLCMRLVSSFGTQINEFIDHKLISKKGDGTYTVPLSHVQLQALASRLENK